MPIRCMRQAFTLIEMMISIAVIVILLSIALPAVSRMWDQAALDNAYKKISNILRVARTRSETIQTPVYGVLFYIDSYSNRQQAVYLSPLRQPISPDESHRDVCDRFEVDPDRVFTIEDVARVAPLEALDWEDELTRNNDYRAGRHRNFFVIMFEKGQRALQRAYILYDHDGDGDELGDMLGLPVMDLIGPSGGPLRDIVVDVEDAPIILPVSWGFVIYDENVLNSPDSFDTPYWVYGLDRYGRTVPFEKEP